MAKQRLYLFDTTMRDGQQTQGVDFSLEDKKLLAESLDNLGLDYIEGGYPGANPKDTQFFDKPPRLKTACFTAFGMVKKPGRSVSNDSSLKALLDARAGAICYVAKSWDFHVAVALNASNKENLTCIAQSVRAGLAHKREVLVDCEHFFDGYKANPSYALDCALTAWKEGARWVVLCDTNGGTLPHEIYDIVKKVTAVIPGANLGIHAHNDTGQAVANSFSAVEAGARQIQGTINGIGERCGNADLMTIIPTLVLKDSYKKRFTTGLTVKKLPSLMPISRLLDEILNRAPNRHAPYIGAAAFAHKGGIHVSAVVKNPTTYEHVDPKKVGNHRQILISDQAGKSNILARLEKMGHPLKHNDPHVATLLHEVKQQEALGFSYDGAQASFELLALRLMNRLPTFFTVESYRVLVEQRKDKNSLKPLSICEATIKVCVDGAHHSAVGEGNGPIHALDTALRKDLGKYSAYIRDMHLADFKVRILTSGTQAVTRVLVESLDTTGERWFTVGISPNIVDASFQALYDSIIYRLWKKKAPPALKVAKKDPLKSKKKNLLKRKAKK